MATTVLDTETTVLETETDQELSAVEEDPATIPQSSRPRSRSRSRNATRDAIPTRDAILPPGLVVRIRSSGRSCILPVAGQSGGSTAPVPIASEASTAPVRIRSEGSTAPVPMASEASTAPVQIASEGSTAPVLIGEPLPSQVPVEVHHARGLDPDENSIPVVANHSVDLDMDPVGVELDENIIPAQAHHSVDVDLDGNDITWRMNGSCMNEPYIPPPVRLFTGIPMLEPSLALPSFLGLGNMAMGSGMSSPMCLAAAFRDTVTRGPAKATFVTDSSSHGLEEAYRFAVAHIEEHVGRDVAFYLGITENPERREQEHLAGGWDYMDVLVEAPSSRETGMLEERLLEQFSRAPLCQNVGRGRERPSGGRPHYVYVVVRLSGLLRRG